MLLPILKIAFIRFYSELYAVSLWANADDRFYWNRRYNHTISDTFEINIIDDINEVRDLKKGEFDEMKNYPNPVTNILSIYFSDDIEEVKTTIVVNNILGQASISNTINTGDGLDVTELRFGTYIVIIKSEKYIK